MNKRTNIRHWHSLHNDWLRALKFYKEELVILGDRLTEIAGKNTGTEIGAQVEHYQNSFILYRNNIEELEYAIHSNLGMIASEIAKQSGFVSSGLLAELENESQVFQEQEKVINDLRHDFNLFSAKWM